MGTPSDLKHPTIKAFFINDFDVARLGFIIEGTSDQLGSGLSFPNRTTGLPGRVGTIALAREFESTPRRIVINGHQGASSRGQLVTDRDALKARCYDGLVELRFGDDPERVFMAYCETFNPTSIAPPFQKAGRGAWDRVRISFLCQDPLAYDREATVLGLTTSRVDAPTGTAPSLPSIRLFGPMTAGAVITYRDFRGTSQATITVSTATTLGSTESLTIDNELSTIVRSDGDNLIGNLSTGSDFFAIDPQDAAGSTGPYPTIELSVGNGDVLFKKAYL